MIITRLKIENWLPFAGKQDLELGAGPYAVVASYTDNPRRSNWAGKTALLEAIRWCLYGVHRKRYEDDVIYQDAELTSVELTIETEQGEYKIKRSRKRGKPTSVQIKRDGETIAIKKAAQEKIESLLGFEDADYEATVCFAQGDTEAIVDRTSGERRKIVGQWLELDSWFRVAAYIRNEVKQYSMSYQEIQTDLQTHRRWVDAQDIVQLEQTIEDAQKAFTKEKRALNTVNGLLDEIAELESARLDFDRVQVLTGEASKLKTEIATSVKAFNQSALDDAHAAYVDRASEVEAFSKELKEANKLVRGEFSGTCPVNGSQCPIADQIRADETTARAKCKSIGANLKAAEKAESEARAVFRSLEAENRSLDRLRERYNGLVRQIKRLKANADRWNPENTIDDDTVTAHKQTRDETMQRLREAEKKHAEASYVLEQIDKYQNTIEALEKQSKNAENQLRIANIALKSVGPSGIPARIAEIALAELEQSANALLTGTGLSFQFAWDRETKDLAPSCYECGFVYKGRKDKACPACDAERPNKRANELEILVDDGSGAVEDVKAKSGGAKVLIGSAVRLAAGLMLRRLRGSQCAWSQIDEPFGALDAENRKTLANTFAGMIDAVGLEQAFVVSHDAALLDSLPNRIEITREGDRSVARVV